MSRPKVLIIYTGGTIGMVSDTRSGALRAMDLDHLEDQVPELARMDVELSTVAFERPIDSSDMRPTDWARIAALIGEAYHRHDGFVVLHGSDTMAYTASALSFLLEGLDKPVILTGSQLPLNTIRTDGKENLLTAIEIAAARENGRPLVPEVAVYFEYHLYRGNRVVKVHAERFEAFRSPDWPELAEAGVHLRYDRQAILDPRTGPLRVHQQLETNIGTIWMFPGITANWVRNTLATPGLRGAVLATFGSGNAPTSPDLLQVLQEARERGVVLVNATQCLGGQVEQGRYETSRALQTMGVVPAGNMTLETAITKLMFLFGQGLEGPEVEAAFPRPICGEVG